MMFDNKDLPMISCWSHVTPVQAVVVAGVVVVVLPAEIKFPYKI